MQSWQGGYQGTVTVMNHGDAVLPWTIAFDLDGTLGDSRADLSNAVNHALKTAGQPEQAESEIIPHVGNGMRVLLSEVFGPVADETLAEGIAAFVEYYEKHCLDHTTLYEGVTESLEELSRSARLAVVTNKPIGFTDKILRGLGIRGRLTSVVGGDSLAERGRTRVETGSNRCAARRFSSSPTRSPGRKSTSGPTRARISSPSPSGASTRMVSAPSGSAAASDPLGFPREAPPPPLGGGRPRPPDPGLGPGGGWGGGAGLAPGGGCGGRRRAGGRGAAAATRPRPPAGGGR